MAKENIEVERDDAGELDIEKRIQSETDRVRTEYSKKLKDLQAELDAARDSATETTEKAVSTLDELKNEIAESRAIAKLNKVTSELLQRAVDGGLDPKVAISVAGSDDPMASLDAIEAEIDRKADIQVNERLSAVPPPRGTPMGANGFDLSRMSQRERDRLPASIRDRAFNDYLTEVV